jgi:hypothetical protein
MPAARPRRQQQQQARLGDGDHFMALPGSELDHQSDAARDAFAGRGGDLDLAAEDDDPGALVDLMLE